MNFAHHIDPTTTAGERTEIIYGIDKTIPFAAKGLSLIGFKHDVVTDENGPSVILGTPSIRDAYFDLKKRGVKVRWITDITKENIHYCKEVMKFAEVRHLHGVRGGFGVSDGNVYSGTAVLQAEGKPIVQLIYSNVKALVEQQVYMFEALWEKATSAEERILEIEKGIKPEVIEIIRESEKALQVGIGLIKEATHEILLIFSSANAFKRQAYQNLLALLEDCAKRGIKIKILTPVDEELETVIQNGFRGIENGLISIRHLDTHMQTRVSILVVDATHSLVTELRRDATSSSIEAMGFSMYSNSKPTVTSYISIFETLWSYVELYDELKCRDIAQREFINVAAHELRGPIQPILGLAEQLHRDPKIRKSEVFLDAIFRNALRLNTLAENILDVARIENRSLKLHKEEFDLRQLIMNAIEDFRNHDLSKEVSFHTPLERPLLVRADKIRIMQVLSNLLRNAVEHSVQREVSDGSESVIVMISAEKKDGYIQVSVVDNGQGIGADLMPRLFSKFTTASKSGSGLGLFISKGIVEAHGGKIWASNNFDAKLTQAGDIVSITKGATFSFTLPD